MNTLVDTHTHLYLEEFDEDRDLVMIRADQAGVQRLFMPNVDDTTIAPLLEMCNRYANCYPLMGLHPTSVDEQWRKRLAKVKEALHSGVRYYGIGEVGMDLYWDKTYCEEQKEALDEQIGWAIEMDLPLIVHCRDAYDELLEVMAPYRQTSLSGIFHSFTGDAAAAERLLSFDRFMLGINGVVTFKNSGLAGVLKDVSLDRLVLETDSPYLSPVPYRGKRNESAHIIEVARKLSEVYEKPLSAIVAKTTDNALKVFKNATNSF